MNRITYDNRKTYTLYKQHSKQ